MNSDKTIKEKIKEKMSQLGVKSVYMTSVHNILAHSYSFYFMSFLLAIILDSFFYVSYFNISSIQYTGIFLTVIASILIFWAQKTSSDLRKTSPTDIHHENFLKGPYRFSRRPTHLGLFLLMLGFGITSNSFWVILMSLVSVIFTKYVFLNEEENFLQHKYGEHYSKYKDIVKL
ncbi:MAG: hypothetical protein NTW62_02330 [Candidatus Nomurabacteria bacterium]|nr:hypothetical protein [Candidatus Nomurabacteria bacterium]